MKLNTLNKEKLGLGQDLLIITDIDLDGVSGAALASLQFPLAKIYSTRQDVIGEFLGTGRIYEFSGVMYIDCSPKRLDDLYTLTDIFGDDNVYIFDHHESFYNMLPTSYKDKFNIDLSHCGAYLFWNYLFNNDNNRMMDFIDLVNRYDMWKDDDNVEFLNAKTLNMKLSYLGVDKFIDNVKKYLNHNQDDIIPHNLKDGFIYYMQQVSKYIDKKCNEAYIHGDEAITFAEEYKSEIANHLLIKYKGKIKRGIVVDVSKNSISIRSKDGSALSKANEISYLSGGHGNAAGARIDGLKKDIINTIIGNVDNED